MPLIYRSMKVDSATGKPVLRRSASALGVRVYTNSRHDDVIPNAEGVVSPGRGMLCRPRLGIFPSIGYTRA